MEKPPTGRLFLFFEPIENYMIGIAFTKEGVGKGRISVSQSQCAEIAQRGAAVKKKKTIHQMPLYFF